MPAQIYWVEAPTMGRLAIVARPRAGDWLDDEIARWKSEDIDVVVSLRAPEEVVELELDKETDLCRERGVEFISFPIPDRSIPPSLPRTVELARQLAFKINNGKSVAIHGRAGMGRSSVIAACVLICTGTEAGAALGLVCATRGIKVPDTDEQTRWIYLFYDAQSVASVTPR
jgi:protein-tyrosine phosphatase